MKSKIYIAQKALCFDKTRKKILANKYLDAKYNADKVKGKFGLPGGKMDFGETPKETLIREVQEETGITIKPILPFYSWTWSYNRGQKNIQIVANAWFCLYKSGQIKKPKDQKEVLLSEAEWILFNGISIQDFIIDEREIINIFMAYQRNNPFLI